MSAVHSTTASGPRACPAAAPCLHALVDEQVRLRPAATAVESPDGRAIDYAELGRRSERVAGALCEAGVRRGDRVGLCARRSVDAIAAILGVLRTGAAYIPLDPSYPRDRVAFMARDATPRLVLVDGREEAVLVGDTAPTLPLADALAGNGAAALGGGEPRPGDVAYVMYTSGSTGVPKGVQVPHAGIVNRLLWEADHFPLDQRDAVLQRTSWSFDISVWEIFMPLSRGARLVLADPAHENDPRYVTDLVASRGITALALVPSLLQALLEERPGMSACPELRDVFCGGEILTASLQRRFFASVDARLHNFYGPTEYSIDATSWLCQPDDERDMVPIGQPLANTSAYVLDGELEPVPRGLPGELYVSGAGLARGYLDRPSLTAERFLPNPFADGDGERMYRTGDQVRRLADGTLEYLGRADTQVKVRGYRVELGEVEAALVRLPQVGRAVAAMTCWNDEPVLGAWVLPTDRDATTPADLRRALADRLPAHMVPTTFTLLDELPTGPTGKVDRDALPLPRAADLPRERSETAVTREDADGAGTDRIAAAFAAVLHADAITPDDSFFSLGGTSLQAVKLVTRLRKDLGRNIPLRLLFDSPTPRELARALDEASC
jgi:amino acid adenylation domain-containing protein